MFDFDALETFVAVVRSGNFSSAASALRLPRTTVSQRVARLEAMLGARLLERTTRVVRPTDAGAAYYERCARILAELEEANAALLDATASPRGHLRIATPLLFGQSMLARVAGAFVLKYPAVQIEIVASDRRVNLIEEGFDLAIVVAARIDDSSLITRKLSSGDLSCCATPAYLAARGTPRSPDELRDHDCIVNREFIASESSAASWTFARGKEVRQVEVRGKLIMNSLMMVDAAMRAGAGIALIPSLLCAADVAPKRLVRLFSEWTIDPNDIRVIYPSNRHLSKRVLLFVDELAKAVSKPAPQVDKKRKAPRKRV
ncbi:MAG: hypothetical protein RLZZ450_7642 [Pseudomonadota bacterium]|jgi:DNA-binding transcriptional LysR family regulator